MFNEISFFGLFAGFAFLIGFVIFAFVSLSKYLKILKTCKKDVADLMSVAHDCFSIRTRQEHPFVMNKHTIVELDDAYFALLLWVWLYGLNSKGKKNEADCFLRVSRRQYPKAYWFYEDLKDSIDLDFMKVNLLDILYLHNPSDREEFIKKLTMSVDYISKTLTSKPTEAKELSNKIGHTIADFIIENKI